MNTLDWIKKTTAVEIGKCELLYIRDFALVWNLFERELENPDNHGILISKMEELEKEDLGMIKFTCLIDYFAGRCMPEGGIAFDSSQLILYRRKKDDSDRMFEDENASMIKEVLDNLTVDNPHVISKSLLPIILRVRNNLFHGNKSIHNVQAQKELFEQIIEFLKLLIDAIGELKGH